MPIKPNYFRATDSGRMLEGTIRPEPGESGALEDYSIAAFWARDDEGDTLIFVRFRIGKQGAVFYLAVSWWNAAVLATSFAPTEARARKLLVEDLNRRGWRFN